MGIRRRLQERRTPLSDAVRHRLLTGRPPAREMEGFWDAMILKGGNRAAAMWLEYQDDLLAEWLAERPGRRPWSWWHTNAREPRQLVAGGGHVVPWSPGHYEWVWREHFGLPAMLELDLEAPPAFESEASYLRRLALLMPEEARALTPDAYEPGPMQLIVADWATPPKAIDYQPFPDADDPDTADEED